MLFFGVVGFGNDPVLNGAIVGIVLVSVLTFDLMMEACIELVKGVSELVVIFLESRVAWQLLVVLILVFVANPKVVVSKCMLVSLDVFIIKSMLLSLLSLVVLTLNLLVVTLLFLAVFALLLTVLALLFAVGKLLLVLTTFFFAPELLLMLTLCGLLGLSLGAGQLWLCVLLVSVGSMCFLVDRRVGVVVTAIASVMMTLIPVVVAMVIPVVVTIAVIVTISGIVVLSMVVFVVLVVTRLLSIVPVLLVAFVEASGLVVNWAGSSAVNSRVSVRNSRVGEELGDRDVVFRKELGHSSVVGTLGQELGDRDVVLLKEVNNGAVEELSH